jgi:2'-5' RNA ligase
VKPSIAINVALLLPDEVDAAAVALNRQLSERLRFDASHLPHITLVQQFIKSDNLNQAKRIVQKLVGRRRPLSLSVTGIESAPFEHTRVWYWPILPDVALAELHAATSAQFEPLRCDGDAASFFTDRGESIRTSTIAYVEEFHSRSSGDGFSPHITIGLGDTQLPQPPFSFSVDRIAICQLGDLNTCRAVVHEQRI